MAWSEEATALFHQVGHDYGAAIASVMTGFAATQRGELDRAAAVLLASRATLRELGDKWASAHILSHLAAVPLRQGDYPRAISYAEEALALARQTGDRLARYVAYLILGQAARRTGDPDRAGRYFRDALRLAAEVADRTNCAYSIAELAGLAAEQGRAERAARLFGAADALLEAAGAPVYVYAPDAAIQKRAAMAARPQLGEADWAVTWEQGRSLTFEQAVAEALAEVEG
jgi:tetratricopeptide (TPR) repeat protein